MDSYNLDLTHPVPKSKGDSAHSLRSKSGGVTSPTVPYMFSKIKICCCQKHVLFGPLVHIAISLSLSLSRACHGFLKQLTNLIMYLSFRGRGTFTSSLPNKSQNNRDSLMNVSCIRLYSLIKGIPFKGSNCSLY